VRRSLRPPAPDTIATKACHRRHSINGADMPRGGVERGHQRTPGHERQKVGKAPALAGSARLVVKSSSIVYSGVRPLPPKLREAGATHCGVEGAYPPARCSATTMEPPVFYVHGVWNSDRTADDRRGTLLWNRLPLAPVSPSPRPRHTNRQATPGRLLLRAPGFESRS
jgi:hypothetical protein